MGKCVGCGSNLIGTPENYTRLEKCLYCRVSELEVENLQLKAALESAHNLDLARIARDLQAFATEVRATHKKSVVAAKFYNNSEARRFIEVVENLGHKTKDVSGIFEGYVTILVEVTEGGK